MLTKGRLATTFSAACLAFLAWAMPGSSQAATLQIDGGGQLTGATNVDVGGVFYDVKFVIGTCAGNFSGCDSPADFAFATKSAADTAAQALLDQVFIGTFNTAPDLTFGCGSPNGCSAMVPYAFDTVDPEKVFATAAFNWANPDFTFDAEIFRLNAYGGEASTDVIVFAQFSPTSEVPLPAALPLFATILAGGGLIAWRRKRRQLLA